MAFQELPDGIGPTMSAKVFQQSASGFPLVIASVEYCIDVPCGSRRPPVCAIGTICTVYHANTLATQSCHGLILIDVAAIAHW